MWYCFVNGTSAVLGRCGCCRGWPRFFSRPPPCGPGKDGWEGRGGRGTTASIEGGGGVQGIWTNPAPGGICSTTPSPCTSPTNACPRVKRSCIQLTTLRELDDRSAAVRAGGFFPRTNEAKKPKTGNDERRATTLTSQAKSKRYESAMVDQQTEVSGCVATIQSNLRVTHSLASLRHVDDRIPLCEASNPTMAHAGLSPLSSYLLDPKEEARKTETRTLDYYERLTTAQF